MTFRDLERRLERLESARDADAPCEECSHSEDIDDRSDATVAYEVTWDHSEPDELEETEFCPKCGRQLVYIVTWSEGGV